MLRGSNGHTNIEENEYDRSQPVGIYGWRKRCLYAFILFLMVVTFVNLALIIWILRVLNFSVHGMGKLRISENGIRLEGEAEFLDTLYTSKIQSIKDKPLTVDASKDIVMRARDGRNNITSSLRLGDKNIEAQCKDFQVMDEKGKTRFRVWEKGVSMEMDEVYYLGSTKVTFNGSIETPNIRGPRSKPLKIEAPSTSINVYADDEINMHAPAGNISVKSAKEIQMRSRDSIILDTAKLYFKNIEISTLPAGSRQNSIVYQLCMCRTGRIFLAAADQECRGTKSICL